MSAAQRDSATAPQADVSVTDESKIRVSGVLDFDTVPALVRKLPPLLKPIERPVVDFSGVRDCNSAGLAFILEINRMLKQQGKSVTFESLPGELASFSRAYDVGEALFKAGILNAASAGTGTA